MHRRPVIRFRHDTSLAEERRELVAVSAKDLGIHKDRVVLDGASNVRPARGQRDSGNTRKTSVVQAGQLIAAFNPFVEGIEQLHP